VEVDERSQSWVLGEGGQRRTGPPGQRGYGLGAMCWTWCSRAAP